MPSPMASRRPDNLLICSTTLYYFMLLLSLLLLWAAIGMAQEDPTTPWPVSEIFNRPSKFLSYVGIMMMVIKKMISFDRRQWRGRVTRRHRSLFPIGGQSSNVLSTVGRNGRFMQSNQRRKIFTTKHRTLIVSRYLLYLLILLYFIHVKLCSNIRLKGIGDGLCAS